MKKSTNWPPKRSAVGRSQLRPMREPSRRQILDQRPCRCTRGRTAAVSDNSSPTLPSYRQAIRRNADSGFYSRLYLDSRLSRALRQRPESPFRIRTPCPSCRASWTDRRSLAPVIASPPVRQPVYAFVSRSPRRPVGGARWASALRRALGQYGRADHHRDIAQRGARLDDCRTTRRGDRRLVLRICAGPTLRPMRRLSRRRVGLAGFVATLAPRCPLAYRRRRLAGAVQPRGKPCPVWRARRLYPARGRHCNGAFCHDVGLSRATTARMPPPHGGRRGGAIDHVREMKARYHAATRQALIVTRDISFMAIHGISHPRRFCGPVELESRRRERNLRRQCGQGASSPDREYSSR